MSVLNAWLQVIHFELLLTIDLLYFISTSLDYYVVDGTNHLADKFYLWADDNVIIIYRASHPTSHQTWLGVFVYTVWKLALRADMYISLCSDIDNWKYVIN